VGESPPLFYFVGDEPLSLVILSEARSVASAESKDPYRICHPAGLQEHHYYVYIMASSSGTLYIGMTKAAGDRSWMHKIGEGSEFTRRYKVDRLVYYEYFRYVKMPSH
jgi:hypothetical protein